ncbi:hypothetical protein BGZ83_000681 [Gryganskiella cystojenkinii]|nr:hypothetical protein BGZ83_000681 [Gryganskiella cystojenkinii]
MSNIQSLSFDALNRRDPSLGRPKVFFESDKTQNEDMMMTDECSVTAGTPPLDLGSDSGEDDSSDLSMRSPSSPRSFLPPPVSILHLRKRKDSQEHLSPIHLFDHNQEMQGTGEVVDYRSYVSTRTSTTAEKGPGNAQSRRPTVTFEVDSVVRTRRCRFRHDDDDDDDDDDDVDERSKVETDINDDHVPESLLLAEQALRRVSLTPLHEEEESNPNNEIKTIALLVGDEQSLQSAPSCTTAEPCSTSHSIASNVTENEATLSSSTTLTTSTTEESTRNSADCAAPKEIILNHILTEPAPQDMLVALFDRSSELEALAAFHSDFFQLMYASVSSQNQQSFKDLLFKTSRSELCDQNWMQTIASDMYLQGHPCLLEKFKAIVGWVGPDVFNCYDGDDDDSETSDLQLWGEDEYGYRDSSFEQVQIKWFRDLEDFSIEVFERYYPQFFINAREKLQGRRMSHGGDSRDHYLIFCETLQLSREDLACDNAWTRRMNGCLDNHPELLLQFKEIIAYEVGYDD